MSRERVNCEEHCTRIIRNPRFGPLFFPGFLKHLENMSPALVLSGDSHRSTYYQLGSPKKMFNGKTDSSRRLKVYKNFLVPGVRNYTFETGMFDGSVKFREESLRLQLRLTNDTPGRLTHEITVPTCSYRMGVPNMGYGYLEICTLCSVVLYV